MIYVIFKADGATVARHYVQRVKSEIDANFYGSNGSYFAIQRVAVTTSSGVVKIKPIIGA